MSRPLIAALAALALLGACSKPEAETAAAQPAAAPAQQANELFTAAPPATRNIGKVLQVQDGGGYTYAEVETAAGQKVWIAGSKIDVKPGTQVEWGNFALMRDFQAKSLNRSFPEILFVDSWGVAGQKPVAVAAHGQFPMPQLNAAPDAAAGPVASGVVKSVVNAGGYSYIEVNQGGKVVWVAASETPMKAGDKVQWQPSTEMSNFTARSLGRTFEKITFAQSVSVAK